MAVKTTRKKTSPTAAHRFAPSGFVLVGSYRAGATRYTALAAVVHFVINSIRAYIHLFIRNRICNSPSNKNFIFVITYVHTRFAIY